MVWFNSIHDSSEKNQNCFCLFNPELYPYRIFLLVLVHPCSFIHSFFLKLVPFTGTNFIFVCNSRTVASSVTSPVEGIAKTICILNSGVCVGGRYSSPPHTHTHPPGVVYWISQAAFTLLAIKQRQDLFKVLISMSPASGRSRCSMLEM